MKFFLKITAGIFALSFVQPCSATSTFTFTGSNVTPGALFDTIIGLMGGNPSTNTATCKISTTAPAPSGTITDASARAALNAATQVTFEGNITGVNGGYPVKIYCSLSDSVPGLIAVYNSSTLDYAQASAITAGYSNAAFGASVTNDPGAVRFAISDISQDSVSKALATVTGLNQNTIIAVIPYVFVANKGSTLTNITRQNARLLNNIGVVPQSFLTGNPGDTNNVYLTGRDNGSGARAIVLTETKYGVTPLVNHFYAATSGSPGSGTITSLRYWPISEIGNFDPWAAGNGGYANNELIAKLMSYSSGGTLNILSADGTPFDPAYDSNVTVVSYLDARNASIAASYGGVLLKYGGNVYDSSPSNLVNSQNSVRNGGYTLWGYERITYQNNLSTDESSLVNQIKNNIVPNLGINGIDPSTMQVSRDGDGYLVGPYD